MPSSTPTPVRPARPSVPEASTTRRLTVVALLVAAAGFVIQMIAGVTDTPTIPPGLVVILVGAGVVAFVPGRWAPLAGVGAGLFNLAASVAVDAADRLTDPSPAAGLAGGWLMHVALVAACVFGTIATARNPRPPEAISR